MEPLPLFKIANPFGFLSSSSTPAAAPAPAPALPPLREFGNARELRQSVYDRTLNAARSIEPLSDGNVTLKLKDVDWKDPEKFSKRARKEALLTGGSLARRMEGTWELSDAAGAVLDSRKQVVGAVPYITGTGTILHRGTDYTVNHQKRLLPGIYARERGNGELESYVNALPGKGASHRYFIDPAKQLFKVRIQQAEMPLLPILHALGATDDEVRKAWGTDIWAANQTRLDSTAPQRFAEKIVRKADMAKPGDMKEKLRAAIEGTELDPEVMQSTLGAPHKNLNKDVILAATKKLLAINRGEADLDDRDHLAYQKIVGPEDLFAERIEKDHGNVRRAIFKKLAIAKSLAKMPSGLLTQQMNQVLTGSGLANPLEEINPAEILDKQSRITSMGEGGLGSLDAIPAESRSVQPSHLNYIDLLRTPESLRAGIDLHLARSARKGGHKLYSPFRDQRTGNIEMKTPQEMRTAALTTPEMFTDPFWSTVKRVPVLRDGNIGYVKRNAVDYVVPDFEESFSHLGNLVPLKSGVKGQRVAMASRMLTQALPLVNAEAPLVQAGLKGTGGTRSYDDEYGRHLGAVAADKGGRVLGVSGDGIKVRWDDGTDDEIDLHNNLPMNRKTLLNQTPLVQAGQEFRKGDILARSNFTDEKGTAALGVNPRMAYMPWEGLNFEDAIAISESMAKKLTSEHAYQHELELTPEHKSGKNAFVNLFPGRFDRKTLDVLDDKGVIKPGSVVEPGQPLILAAKEKSRSQNKIHKRRQPGYADESIVWDHHDSGVVTDVAWGKTGPVVVVKSLQPMRQGDKLCFDDATRILSKTRGWISVAEVQVGELVWTLNPQTECGEWQPVTHAWAYDHIGKMYELVTKHIDMLVTLDHRLWVCRPGENYEAVTAQDFYASNGEWQFKKDCGWEGTSPKWYEFPLSRSYSSKVQVLKRVRMEDWCEFLGYYLAEGWCAVSNYGECFAVRIGQFRASPAWAKIAACLDRLGLTFRYNDTDGRFEIGNTWLFEQLQGLGDSYTKYVPEYIQELNPRLLAVFFDAYMAGDGHKGACWEYCSSSRQLAYDLQLVCMKLGWSVRLIEQNRTDNWSKMPSWRGRVNRKHLRPWWKKSRAAQYASVRAGLVDFSGKVYCVTVPNHIVYVERGGKTHWSMNSGRYGDKGVISSIIPDDQMPVGADGQPLELIANDLGTISRTNPAQHVEGQLGKIAALLGKAIKVPDFDNQGDMVAWAKEQLDKHGLQDMEDLYLPKYGRTVKAQTGRRFFMKLHHTSESKQGARGGGGYSADDTPAKGGASGSKRIGMLVSNALLSHGAIETLKDIRNIRGQKQEQWWLQFMQGHSPTATNTPLTFQKTMDYLRASGIHVGDSKGRIHIKALTNKDIDELAGDRNIQNGETVNFDDELRPIKNGLFDEQLTGGHNARKFSAIQLPESLPNPAFEEPIRRVLGLTQKQLYGVLAGEQPLGQHGTGSPALANALGKINLDAELKKAESEWRYSRGQKREDAVRRWGFLKGAKDNDLHPKDWMISRAPVLPTAFRPVNLMGNGVPLVSDPNYLYKHLIESSNLFRKLKSAVGEGGAGQERLGVYQALKATVGLGEPTHPKLVEKNVHGLLKSVFGDSPKYGMYQRKLLATTVDNVGRGVIVPNPDLDIDSIGIPENQAFPVYAKFIVRDLKRKGLPIREALRHVLERTDLARKTLVDEMDRRPVYMDRAPVLHKFGIMALKPRLVSGDVIHMAPLLTKGYGADFDGDTVNFHVPSSDAAVREAYERMLPSRSLLSPGDFKTPNYMPNQEYLAGLYRATKEPKADKAKRARVFRNIKDALGAFARGDIADIHQAVEILEHER